MRLFFRLGVPGTITRQVIWDLWWTKWHWTRFFDDYLGVLLIITPMFHTLISVIFSQMWRYITYTSKSGFFSKYNRYKYSAVETYFVYISVLTRPHIWGIIMPEVEQARYMKPGLQTQFVRQMQKKDSFSWVHSVINPYPTAFPYGNGMVLHFYQQQESSTTKTVHKVINKGLKTYV